MERRIIIKLDGDVVDDFDFDFNDNMSEDSIYEAVCEYVYGNIEIEIL